MWSLLKKLDDSGDGRCDDISSRDLQVAVAAATANAACVAKGQRKRRSDWVKSNIVKRQTYLDQHDKYGGTAWLVNTERNFVIQFIH